MDDHIRLAGLGLVLREWRDDDLPVMVDLFDETEVGRWTPLQPPFGLDAARAYLDAARRRRAADKSLQLAVTVDGEEALGEILLARTDDERTAELAYAIGKPHRRQGLAHRAVSVMTDYAYRVLGMTDVILRIAAENVASAMVARRAGFHPEGTDPITRKGAGHPLFTWRHVVGDPL